MRTEAARDSKDFVLWFNPIVGEIEIIARSKGINDPEIFNFQLERPFVFASHSFQKENPNSFRVDDGDRVRMAMRSIDPETIRVDFPYLIRKT